MRRKKERASYPVRFPLCGFVRPTSEKQPTVATDFDAFGPIDLYMCKIDCLECDRRLGALEMRKRYEETTSHDARWSDAIGEDMNYTLEAMNAMTLAELMWKIEKAGIKALGFACHSLDRKLTGYAVEIQTGGALENAFFVAWDSFDIAVIEAKWNVIPIHHPAESKQIPPIRDLPFFTED